MKRHWLMLAFALALGTSSLQAQGPPVDLSVPEYRPVLLPPQTCDVPVKMPNNTREHYGEWSVSGGVYFMQPVFGTNPAFVINTGNLSHQFDFSHNLDVAPFAWLSYTSERGWGIRGRWFEFDHGSSASYSTQPGETVIGASPLATGRSPIDGTIFASSNLAVTVADIQATCNFDYARWSHLLGIGVRYAHLSEDYRATLTSPTTLIDLNTGHNFNGAGPCFSVETKRRITENGFSIYGQLHGAILFGENTEAYSAINNDVAQQFVRRHVNVMPVGELEVGGEYERCMGRAKLFIQAGFVGQIWWGAGNASNFDPLASTSASNSNLGFIGLALRAGVRY